MKLERAEIVQLTGWGALLSLALGLNLYLGLALGCCLMAAVSLRFHREAQSASTSAEFAELQAAVQAASAEQAAKLSQLIDHFNNLRAEEALRRSASGAVNRIRG